LSGDDFQVMGFPVADAPIKGRLRQRDSGVGPSSAGIRLGVPEIAEICRFGLGKLRLRPSLNALPEWLDSLASQLP
jgi:hypothetical protein